MENTTPGEVFTVATFCEAHKISRALFYKLRNEGKAPHTFNIGRRVLISKDAARAWLSRMEGTAA